MVAETALRIRQRRGNAAMARGGRHVDRRNDDDYAYDDGTSHSANVDVTSSSSPSVNVRRIPSCIRMMKPTSRPTARTAIEVPTETLGRGQLSSHCSPSNPQKHINVGRHGNKISSRQSPGIQLATKQEEVAVSASDHNRYQRRRDDHQQLQEQQRQLQFIFLLIKICTGWNNDNRPPRPVLFSSFLQRLLVSADKSERRRARSSGAVAVRNFHTAFSRIIALPAILCFIINQKTIRKNWDGNSSPNNILLSSMDLGL